MNKSEELAKIIDSRNKESMLGDLTRFFSQFGYVSQDFRRQPAPNGPEYGETLYFVKRLNDETGSPTSLYVLEERIINARVGTYASLIEIIDGDKKVVDAFLDASLKIPHRLTRNWSLTGLHHHSPLEIQSIYAENRGLIKAKDFHFKPAYQELQELIYQLI